MARKPLSPRFDQNAARRARAAQDVIDAVNATKDARDADFAALGRAMQALQKAEADMRAPAFAKIFNAAGDGKLHLVKKYIERDGMDVDVRNRHGYTPLGYAVSDGNMALVDYLIGRGADVNARSIDGLTPVLMAASKNHAAVVRRLLEAGANPRSRTKTGLTLRKIAEFNSAHAVIAVLDDKPYMARFAKAPAGRAPKA